MKVVVAGDIPESDMPEWIAWGFNLETAHAINLGMTTDQHIRLDVNLARANARQRLIKREAA